MLTVIVIICLEFKLITTLITAVKIKMSVGRSTGQIGICVIQFPKGEFSSFKVRKATVVRIQPIWIEANQATYWKLQACVVFID